MRMSGMGVKVRLSNEMVSLRVNDKIAYLYQGHMEWPNQVIKSRLISRR